MQSKIIVINPQSLGLNLYLLLLDCNSITRWESIFFSMKKEKLQYKNRTR